MSTPSVTPTQYGAGSLFAAVAIACLSQGVTGTDLLAYLGSSALVTVGLVLADAIVRNGRAHAYGQEFRGVQANFAAFGTTVGDDTDPED